MNDKQLKTEGFYAGCGEGLELERRSMDIQIVFCVALAMENLYK